MLTVERYIEISHMPKPKADVNNISPKPITAPWTIHAFAEGTARIRIAPKGMILSQATDARMPSAILTRSAKAISAGER